MIEAFGERKLNDRALPEVARRRDPRLPRNREMKGEVEEKR